MKRRKIDNSTLTLIVIPPVVLIVIVAVVLNVLAVRWSGVITRALGQSSYRIESGGSAADAQYFVPDYADFATAAEASQKVAYDIAAEGIVLLENDASGGGGLPLGGGSDGRIKVSCFSVSSVNFVYGGSGSGSVNTQSSPTLKEAFEYAGMSVNPELWSFYEQKYAEGYARAVPGRGSKSFSVNEVPWSDVSPIAAQTASEYSDAAIVIISRTGCEGSDLPAYGFSESEGVSGNSGNYLEFTRSEYDMLCGLGVMFDNIIVVINANNPMELGLLEGIKNVNSVLWAGGLGSCGLYALADIIAGKVNPSGRLTDTYACDNLSSPAAVNSGTNFFIENYPSSAPYADEADQYIAELEGIYVGYRYFETRYEDAVAGRAGVGDYRYEEEVAYPFGYGLSYTRFRYDDFAVSFSDEKITVTLTVTNTGEVAGRDVVQIYAQSPYTQYDISHGIEKSSVELLGFAKTNLLAPGESCSVSVESAVRRLASYDSSGNGGYILEDGTYYIAFGRNVHDALNNILAEKGFCVTDGMTEEGDPSFVAEYVRANGENYLYAASVTGGKICNRFASADIRYYFGDGVKYLSRSDWTGTWPQPFADRRDQLTGEMYKTFPQEFIDDLAPQYDLSYLPEDAVGSGKQGLNLAMLIGVDYDNAAWHDFLAMLTEEQLLNIVRTGGFGNPEIIGLNVPSTTMKDGPAGISKRFGEADCTAFPCEVVVASAWNSELAYKMGVCIGNEALFSDVDGWYAPSVNIHRTPFGGRNFEYYSEDGFLSGVMAAATVSGAQSKGLVCYVKHFALNDTEGVNSGNLSGSKDGLATFACEQAIREIYLEPFEYAVIYGGANGIMNAFNRIGARWCGNHSQLQNGVLREEWGFDGCIITDKIIKEYMDVRAGLMSGTDLWMNSRFDALPVDDAYIEEVMPYVREAAHRSLYVISASAAMNGLSSDSAMVPCLPLWQVWLIAGDVVLAALSLAGIVWVIASNLRSKEDA